MTKVDTVQANGLTEQQKMALPYLIAFISLKDACKQVGITRATFYKWLRQGNFEVALKEQRDSVFVEAVEILHSNVNAAVSKLIDLLDTTESENLKRVLCNDIINCTMRAIEFGDMEGPIIELETAVSEGNAN